MKRKGRKQSSIVWSALLLLTLLICSQAGAQGTNASIRGTVIDKTGPLPGASVVAVNTQSGFKYEATTADDGSFLLGGLVPETYEVTVTMPGYTPSTTTITVTVGQSAKLVFTIQEQALQVENVAVVGTTIVEPKISSITTSVSQQQMQSLPQNNRNFLSFAQLAPGVLLNDNQSDTQVFRSGGMVSRQVNVYIDGLSYKNDLTWGGAFMQDSSKGNPFPQGAIQEYTVITQNYKAEYEKAAAAIVTAVTKSGGSAWHGDALILYQDKSMISLDAISEEKGYSKPDYKKYQGAVSIGGPIVKDKMNFFFAWENNTQDAYNTVSLGSGFSQAPASVQQRLAAYPTGNILAPFHSNLFFGKLTYQPDPSSTFELSANVRDESEKKDFGGQRSYENAVNFKDNTSVGLLRWQTAGNTWINEALVSYQTLEWNPTALNPDLINEVYDQILQVGGTSSNQDLKQQKYGIRDDYTHMWGAHNVKFGAGYNYAQYDMNKGQNANPEFDYRPKEDWLFPYQARFGSGDPNVHIINNQYGLYAQDDWNVAPQVQLNIGLRWDLETNMFNNNWVTPSWLVDSLHTSSYTYPDETVVKLTDVLDVNNYITDGNDRPAYKGMIQPRVGFSWDVTGQAKTVVFGAYGIYYDRVSYNDVFDEKYRFQWPVYAVCFTADGNPTNDCSIPVKWDPKYLSKQGIADLVASGSAGAPEVFLVNNNLKPPKSDQWTIGVRQQFGRWLTSLSYNDVHGQNGLAWWYANLLPTATFDTRWGSRMPISTPRGNTVGVFKATSDLESWYSAAYLTIDKPYTADSRWGFNVAYTYTDAKQNNSSYNGQTFEGVPFQFDGAIRPSELSGFKINGNWAEKQRLVMSGTVGLPASFTVSGLITLGSGLPFSGTDCSAGWDKCVQRLNAFYPETYTFILGKWAYRSVDLRVDWTANLGGGMGLGLILEGFNIFNYANYSGFDGWQPALPEVNANFGKPSSAYNPRKYQFGVRFSF